MTTPNIAIEPDNPPDEDLRAALDSMLHYQKLAEYYFGKAKECREAANRLLAGGFSPLTEDQEVLLAEVAAIAAAAWEQQGGMDEI